MRRRRGRSQRSSGSKRLLVHARSLGPEGPRDDAFLRKPFRGREPALSMGNPAPPPASPLFALRIFSRHLLTLDFTALFRYSGFTIRERVPPVVGIRRALHQT